MPRAAREKSPTDYYHIMMRGINKDKIFHDTKYKKLMMDLMTSQLREGNVRITAYCAMDNHIHLVARGDLKDLSHAIKKANTRFAMRLNKDFERVGHVFQDRFRSEVIYNDQHLLQVIRYVHNNPVKARIVEHPGDYKWSSYLDYLGRGTEMIDRTDINEILEIAGGLRSFKDFHTVEDHAEFLDTKEELEEQRLWHAQRIISNYCVENGIEDVREPGFSDHLEGLVEILLKESRLSHRKIAGLLEIDHNRVHLVSKRM